MAGLALASSEPPIVLQFAAERRERLARMGGYDLSLRAISNEQLHAAWLILDEDRPITLREINQAACVRFNVGYDEFLSPRRFRQLFYARALAVLVAKEITSYSLPVIGRHLGGRDHTTILAANKRARGLMKSDKRFAAHVTALIKQFRPSFDCRRIGGENV